MQIYLIQICSINYKIFQRAIETKIIISLEKLIPLLVLTQEQIYRTDPRTIFVK